MSPRGGGGTKATPGRTYIKQDDGSFEEIASEAFGKPGSAPLVWGANPGVPTSGVKKGTLLIIPGNPPPSKLTGKQPDELTILIDGMEVPMLSARIIRTVDTGSDGWTGRIAWKPGENEKLDRATRPYGYPRAAAYIGNELLVGGCLYVVQPEMTVNGLTKGLHGYSFTADAIDSHVQPPYEYNNVSLKQLAEALAPPLGITPRFADNVLTECNMKFTRVTSHEADTVFAFLAKLATQRGILISSTPQGDLYFCRANDSSKPVGTLRETEPIVTGWKAEYNGRKRFHAYKCITKGGKQGVVLQWGNPAYGASSKQGPSTVISLDDSVPRSRTITFHADDTTPGNIKNAAKWRKNRQFVEALTQEFPVTGWYAPDGTLWRENTLVTVISPTLGVPKGYTFLIRAVEYILEGGRTAILSLIPPQAYTDKDIGDIWT